MAFATITFPTMIFYSIQLFRIEITNSNDTKNSGFYRFYGSLLNGEALSTRRSNGAVDKTVTVETECVERIFFFKRVRTGTNGRIR